MERVDGKRDCYLCPDQVATVAPPSEGRELTKTELGGLMGVSLPFLEGTIEDIREISPYFHPNENQQWSPVDLQALAIHLAYYHGQREQDLLSLLPEDFPPQMFEEIDETFLSYRQIADLWGISPNYASRLIELIFSKESIIKMPHRQSGDNCHRSIPVFPPKFCFFVREEFEAARKEGFALSRWIRHHQERILLQAERYLPEFPKEYQQWLEENITEIPELPKPWWRPDLEDTEMLVLEVTATIAGIEARALDIDTANNPGVDDQRRIHLSPLSYVSLSADEEKILGKAIFLMLQAKKERPFPQDQLPYNEIVKIGESARKIMIEANLRLIFFATRKWFSKGKERDLSFEDLFQEGVIGLSKAVEGFDYRRNNKFSTYAFWWIEREIRRKVEDYLPIRIPRGRQEKIRRELKSLEEQQKVFATEGKTGPRRAAEAEIDSLTGSLYPSAMSLDGSGKSLSSPQLPIGEQVFQGIERKKIKEAFRAAELTEQERRVLINFLQGETLADIGRFLGLSRERIRQLKELALEKVKNQLKKDPFFQLS